MSEHSTADILRAAKERISDRNHFVMGALAWNRQGRQVDPTASDAWRWNARGAICLESGVRPTPWQDSRNGGGNLLYRLLDEAAWGIVKERGETNLLSQDASDNLDHALTLQALDTAIANAEAIV